MTELPEYNHFVIIHTSDDNPISISVEPNGIWNKTIKKWRIHQSNGNDTLHECVKEDAKLFTRNFKGTQNLFSKLYKSSFENSLEVKIKNFENELSLLKRNKSHIGDFEILADKLLAFCGISICSDTNIQIKNNNWKFPYGGKMNIRHHFTFTNSGYPTGLFSSILYDLLGENTYKLRLTNNEFHRRNPLFWNRDVMALARIECENNYNNQLSICSDSKSVGDEILYLISNYDTLKDNIWMACGVKQAYFPWIECISRSNNYEIFSTNSIMIKNCESVHYAQISALSKREFSIISCQLYLNNSYYTFVDYEQVNGMYVIHHNVNLFPQEVFLKYTSLLEKSITNGKKINLLSGYIGRFLKMIFIKEILFSSFNNLEKCPITSKFDQNFLIENNLSSYQDLLKQENSSLYEYIVNEFFVSKLDEIIYEFNDLSITTDDISKFALSSNNVFNSDEHDNDLFNGNEFYSSENSIVLKSRLESFMSLDRVEKEKNLLDLWIDFRLSEWWFHYGLKFLRFFMEKNHNQKG